MTKMPCAVSGRMKPLMRPDGPIWVLNIRLNSNALVTSFLVSGDCGRWGQGGEAAT